MTREDQERFPPVAATLKDGRQVVLRPLQVEDADKLSAFYEAIPRSDFRFYCPHPLDREHARANAANALSPVEVVIVMETPGEDICGYAWSRWKDEAAPQSTFGICVRPDCQGVGAGERLMSRLAEIARVIGPAVMHLTVQKANARAVQLYQRMGFEIVREGMREEWLGFPPEPQYWMSRRTRPE